MKFEDMIIDGIYLRPGIFRKLNGQNIQGAIVLKGRSSMKWEVLIHFIKTEGDNDSLNSYIENRQTYNFLYQEVSTFYAPQYYSIFSDFKDNSSLIYYSICKDRPQYSTPLVKRGDIEKHVAIEESIQPT